MFVIIILRRAYKKFAYVLIVVIFVLAGANIAVNMLSNEESVDGEALANFDPDTIVIDAGHGGPDGGASNAGVAEKDINLSIAMMLQDLYKASGYKVIMTRTEDCSTVDMPNGKFNKKEDIKKRLDIVQRSHNSLAISVHQNQFTSQNIWGAQVFYGKNHSVSKDIATQIQGNVHMLSPENKRVAKPITSDVYLVHKATIPIVLVECGFLSNAQEREKLQQEEYQRLIAFWIYGSVLQATTPNKNMVNNGN